MKRNGSTEVCDQYKQSNTTKSHGNNNSLTQTSHAVTVSAPRRVAIIANKPVPVPMSNTRAFLPTAWRPLIADSSAL